MDLSDSLTGGGIPRRVNAMEAVLAQLRGAIERGEFTVGDKLPSEAELGQRFEVSRSVVREALRALQALGLTVSRAGKGTYVSAHVPAESPMFGVYSARDLLEVRRHVEIPVAAYAASRRTEDDLDVLGGLLGRMEEETGTTEWVALDTQFHITVARSSGNPVFRKVIEEIRDGLSRQSAFLTDLVHDRREQANREHRAIVEAIAGRSAEIAVRTMTAHLERVESTLTTIVRPGSRAADATDDGGHRG